MHVTAVSCFSSLHTKSILLTIVVFFIVGLILTVGLAFENPQALEKLETRLSLANIRRVSSSLRNSVSDLHSEAKKFSSWPKTSSGVDALAQSGPNSPAFLSMLSASFSSPDPSTWSSSGQNLVAFYSPNGTHLWSIYHPVTSDSGASILTSSVPPLFLGIDADSNDFLARLWPEFNGIVNPPGGFSTLELSVLPIISSSEKVHGFQIWGREVLKLAQLFSDETPSCLGLWGTGNVSSLPKDVALLVPTLIPAPLSGRGIDESADSDEEWGEYSIQSVLSRSQVESTPGRFCPRHAQATSNKFSVSYIVFSDGFAGHQSGPIFRVDSPRSFFERGSRMFQITAAISVVFLVFLAALFITFLEIFVLRRLDRLRNFVSSISSDVELDSFMGASPGHDASSSSSPEDEAATKGKDEIAKLGKMAGRQAEWLRSKLDKLNAQLLELSSAWAKHTKAMKMMNLWSQRGPESAKVASSFPVAKTPRRRDQSSKDDQRVLAELVGNPISLEFLKVFCASEGVLQNLLFLFDAAAQRCRESSGYQRRRWGTQQAVPAEIASFGLKLRQQYFGHKSEALVKVSQEARKKLGKGSSYEPGMFDLAVAEVTRGLVTVTIPKFCKSSLFDSCMLAIEAEGAALDQLGSLKLAPPSSQARLTRRGSFLEKILAIGRSVIHDPSEVPGIESSGMSESESSTDSSSTIEGSASAGAAVVGTPQFRAVPSIRASVTSTASGDAPEPDSPPFSPQASSSPPIPALTPLSSATSVTPATPMTPVTPQSVSTPHGRKESGFLLATKKEETSGIKPEDTTKSTI